MVLAILFNFHLYVCRYLYLLVTGLESCTTTSAADHELYVDQQNDICLLRLLAAFLGSTPQIAIQTYILICTQQANWITGSEYVIVMSYLIYIAILLTLICYWILKSTPKI